MSDSKFKHLVWVTLLVVLVIAGLCMSYTQGDRDLKKYSATVELCLKSPTLPVCHELHLTKEVR